jgi:hypothetical protein
MVANGRVLTTPESQSLTTLKNEYAGYPKGLPGGPIIRRGTALFEPTKREATNYGEKKLAGEHSQTPLKAGWFHSSMFQCSVGNCHFPAQTEAL